MYNKKIPIDISCGFRIAIEVMGGKWELYIIYELLDGPKRPSALGFAALLPTGRKNCNAGCPRPVSACWPSN